MPPLIVTALLMQSSKDLRPSAPIAIPTLIALPDGNSFPSNAMNPAGLFRACSTKYSCEPTSSNAASMDSLTDLLILLGTPFGLPFPALGGNRFSVVFTILLFINPPLFRDRRYFPLF
jgi:hypothetical protein